jgi:hypothetical protein
MISRTTKEFWKLFDVLPKTIRNQTVKTYKVWNNNPNHPSLHFKHYFVKKLRQNIFLKL